MESCRFGTPGGLGLKLESRVSSCEAREIIPVVAAYRLFQLATSPDSRQFVVIPPAVSHVGGRFSTGIALSELFVAKYTGDVSAPTTLSSRAWKKRSRRNSPPNCIRCLPFIQLT